MIWSREGSREGARWQWLGIEVGCWVGVKLVEAVSDLCSQWCALSQPPLAGFSFISYSGTVSN